MQAIIDFIPLVLALIAYKTYDIYAATIVLMVTLPLIPLSQYLMRKPVSQMYIWSAALMLVFGTLTLTLRNPLFLMWKPTILYAAAGVAFLILPMMGQTPVIERMLGGSIRMPAERWRQLNTIWALFFLLLATINIVVAYSVDEATWFQFKVWGLTGLFLVFILAQSVWVGLHMSDEPDSDSDASGNENSNHPPTSEH